jgi:uncharacterized membrane protein YqgA involved in biofilm formation
MIIEGTIVNIITVVAGSLIGYFFKRHLSLNIQQILMQGLGLSTILIGLKMGFETENLLIVICSLVIGGAIGEVLMIEARLERIGDNLKERFGKGEGRFTEAFLTASLVYCVGAMTVLGSLQDGLGETPVILYTKSMLDGVAAIVFTSTLGIGAIFAALTILVYQGLLTLFASFLKPILTDAMIREMTAVGGLLIVGIGINLLDIRKIKVGNLLPAILIAVLIVAIIGLFGG